MATPTLAALQRALGEDLQPYPPGRRVPSTPVTAVHVSELPDPSRYLDGGELLLTTGLSAIPSAVWFRGYVARLRDAGVAGLALGLGPRFAEVPSGFVRAAESSEVPLFVVPVRTQFLTISRRFWQLYAVPDRRRAASALALHRALVEAAASANPEATVLQRLASGVRGWAVRLSAEGAVEGVYPGSARGRARELRHEVRRCAIAGMQTALTLPVSDQIVVVHPVIARSAQGADQSGGYVAVGSSAPLPAEHRHLVLAGVALLGAQLGHRRELRVAEMTARAPVLRLLVEGSPDAARTLARIVVPEILDRPVLAVVLRGPGRALDRAWTETAGAERCLAGWLADGVLRLVVRAADDTAQWLRGLTATGLAGAVGPVGHFDALATNLDVLAGRVATGEPGELLDLGSTDSSLLGQVPPRALGAWATALLGPVLAYERADVVGALTAFLRHAGAWEPAARELRVHRHTLRYRIDRAAELLGTDLADPDRRAELWLALRALGRA